MIKKEKGITLISLIIVIALITILTSTVAEISMERFDINKLNKMTNDLELLSDKVLNYYLQYGKLPILKSSANIGIEYTYTTLDFQKNSMDNEKYYIIDLDEMEGISLNYGKEGYENPNTSDDVYIINEATHTVYYVKGIELSEKMYHYIQENGNLSDTIPPSKPEIKVISGTKNDEGAYTSDVEIEIISGKDSWSGIAGTTYSLDNGATWNIFVNSSNIFTITENGTYAIKAKSYDNANNYSEETNLVLQISK